MIENMLVHFFIGAVLVIVALVALLPLKGKKGLLAVGGFFPIFASRHDLPDQMAVIARANIVFVGFSDGLQWFLKGDRL